MEERLLLVQINEQPFEDFPYYTNWEQFKKEVTEKFKLQSINSISYRDLEGDWIKINEWSKLPKDAKKLKIYSELELIASYKRKIGDLERELEIAKRQATSRTFQFPSRDVVKTPFSNVVHSTHIMAALKLTSINGHNFEGQLPERHEELKAKSSKVIWFAIVPDITKAEGDKSVINNLMSSVFLSPASRYGPVKYTVEFEVLSKYLGDVEYYAIGTKRYTKELSQRVLISPRKDIRFLEKLQYSNSPVDVKQRVISIGGINKNWEQLEFAIEIDSLKLQPQDAQIECVEHNDCVPNIYNKICTPHMETKEEAQVVLFAGHLWEKIPKICLKDRVVGMSKAYHKYRQAGTLASLLSKYGLEPAK